MIVIININKKLRKLWLGGATSEDLYLAYRILTGKSIKKSWAYVKPLIKKWGGCKNG